MAIIFDAQKEYDFLLADIKTKLADMPKLCLASVAVGQDPSAKSYRLAQEKLAKELGIEYRSIDLGLNNSYQDFKTEIKRLNQAKEVTGIILNKPFPPEWNDADVFSLLSEEKDIEGMHPANLGRFFLTQPRFTSPTVLSVMRMIDESKVQLRGRRVVLVGFSPLIGRPLALWLGSKLATVSITHIGTFEEGDLPSYIERADIVISAVGKPGLIKGDWIKEKAIVIDVGTGYNDNKISGDVEFDKAKEKAAFITPVPGGVGKLTTMFLYRNLVLAYKLSLKS